MHVVHSIDANTLDHLKSLARANVDSSRSLALAARSSQSPELRELFESMSQGRRGNVEALSAYAQVAPEEFEARDSLYGALHRWWLHLCTSREHGNLRAVVAEAERSEAEIQRSYERVLVLVAGHAIHDVLHSQYREVLRNQERIRDIGHNLPASQS